ncbi:integrase core domain-containing protein [Aureimonas sp. N4]|uniref:integrase core domain-containing protein n=1 Tax=Aureimonas sp. N4 TaxID=1638165 RepID=UPI0009E69F25
MSKLRDERLNGEIFYSHAEARIIKSWRQHDKTERPHSSLGYRLPAPAAVPGLTAQPKPASQANSNVADKPSMLLI